MVFGSSANDVRMNGGYFQVVNFLKLPQVQHEFTSPCPMNVATTFINRVLITLTTPTPPAMANNGSLLVSSRVQAQTQSSSSTWSQHKHKISYVIVNVR